MSEQRRKFSPQFKAEAVQMVIETGKPIAEVARDLGVVAQTLGNWVTAWRHANPEPDRALSPVERARVSELEEENRRLRMENELLKKQRPSSPRRTRSRALRGDRGGEGLLRRGLDVSVAARATLEIYAWRNKIESPGGTRRRELAGQVRRVFDASRQTSGCRRVTAQLNREGHPCSVGMVADLMRELGLAAVQPRAYKRTTVPGECPVSSPDLIGRDLTAPAPGQRLVGDITYLKTGEGWLYLATVLDLATRMVVGWQLATHMRTSLIVDALAMALHGGHVQRDAIFHSDRGSRTPQLSLPCSARTITSAPVSDAPVCVGTTPPPKASSPR